MTSPVSQLKRTKHANQCSRKIHWFRLNFISWCSNKFVRCVCSFLRRSPHWISPKSYTFASYHTFWFWNLNLNLIFIAIIFHIYFASFSGHLDLPSVRSFSFSFFLYFVIIIFLFRIFEFAPSKLVLRLDIDYTKGKCGTFIQYLGGYQKKHDQFTTSILYFWHQIKPIQIILFSNVLLLFEQ